MLAYGFREQVLKLVSGLFDASLFIQLQRLTELICGFNRRKGEGPTSYPVACSRRSGLLVPYSRFEGIAANRFFLTVAVTAPDTMEEMITVTCFQSGNPSLGSYFKS